MSETYTTTPGNARSSTRWARPGMEPASSWMLGRFISVEPRRELQELFIYYIKQCPWFRNGHKRLCSGALVVNCTCCLPASGEWQWEGWSDSTGYVFMIDLLSNSVREKYWRNLIAMQMFPVPCNTDHIFPVHSHVHEVCWKKNLNLFKSNWLNSYRLPT